MSQKNYVYGLTLAAAVNSSFDSTFKGASKVVLSLNETLSEQGKIMGFVQEAYSRGIIRQNSYTNAVKYTNVAIEKLQKAQASALTTQTKLDLAQTNFIKHSVNLMRYRENFSVLTLQ